MNNASHRSDQRLQRRGQPGGLILAAAIALLICCRAGAAAAPPGCHCWFVEQCTAGLDGSTVGQANRGSREAVELAHAQAAEGQETPAGALPGEPASAEAAAIEAAPVEAVAAEPASAQSPMRTWTDATGAYTVVAALVDAAEGKVRLKKPDATLIVVPMERLSLADLRYVREELRSRREQGSSGPGLGAGSKPTSVPSNWPGWRGPNRDGKSPDTGLLKQWPEGGPPRLWHATGIGEGYSSVAVVDGMVYITGKLGDTLVLTALDMDGKRLWQVPVGPAFTASHPGARATPTIDEGNLYLVTGKGLIVCCDAKTGRNQWTRQMSDFGGRVPGWGYAESVLILGDLAVVTPGGANCIVALDKKTGQPVWSSQGFEAGAQYSSCIAFEHGGTPLVVNGTHSGIVAVDARNGRVLWSDSFSAGNTANCPTPVYQNGYVFWATGYGKGGVCLKLGPQGLSATRAWTTRDMVCHHGGYIVHEGYIYGNNGGGWACLELTTGQVMWQERAVGKGSLCFADGMLYLFGENGGRVALATCSPQGMEIRGEFQVAGDGPSWAHPVVVGGRLYVRYADNLYCFDLKARD